MRKFKLPQSTQDLSGLIQKMRTDSAVKLSKFCTKQILDKRLSTKTFNYEFDISGTRSGGQRKSVQKLREILWRHVKKQIPYLEYIRGSDNYVQPISHRPNAVMINLESQYFPITVSRADRDPFGTALDLRWTKSLQRYCRRMRYKCMRAGIPLSLSEETNCEFHPDDVAPYEQWNNKRQGELLVRVKIRMVVIAELSIYQYSDYIRSHQNGQIPEVKSYLDYEKYLEGPAFATQRRRFHNVNNWSISALTSPSRVTPYPGYERFTTAEKIFTVLDEMIKVLTTLTRRVQYDTAAFDVGSIENS